ncbi:polysaccharide deacetylase family protein [Cecembia rubra]|uniref:Polysaccharide deacetylase n=1 Tax=Cecembia rubra TaxID=1485585 RepID=A0A2P8DW21_9BACT|nr:polysaccharide deacetylase family protein [Cecembia rubra]PSL01423.1 polysaccharide deacetylase [Cecembia rubra]
MKPFLIISLDFELHWGRFDKKDLEQNLLYYRRTRESIPEVLELFHQYEIHATWATVGSLMAESEEEWKTFWPELKPTYEENRFSAYVWRQNQSKIWEEALFAPDLVKRIIDCPGQELGSHTFSHYYTCEKGQQKEEFRADLIAAKKIAWEKFERKLYSLVFPRNQMDLESVNIVKEEGFRAIRTNPSDWYWKKPEDENLVKRIFRTGDTLYPLGSKTTFNKPLRKQGEILEIPASRLLRPFKESSLFNQRRIRRIKGEMDYAARNGEVYHLWWHPHNFGNFPKENLLCLKELLDHFKYLRNEFGMTSISMSEV